MMTLDDDTLRAFVIESNRIEGIVRTDDEVLAREVAAHAVFLDNAEHRGHVAISDLERLVSVLQPGAKLREHRGMNVQVGTHLPPPGGPMIRSQLDTLLDHMENAHPYVVHCAYETLHPFMDGNGRSGRALWLWQMCEGGYDGGLLFLHAFYYQALRHSR